MSVNFNLRKTLPLLVVLFLVIAIPLTLNLVEQRQEVKEKAFSPSEGKVAISIDPPGSSLERGASFLVTINLANNDSARRQIYAAGVDLSFDPNVFQISNPACASVFGQTVINSVDQEKGKLFLSCFRGGGEAPLNLEHNAPSPLGVFRLEVQENAPIGQTQIEFTRGVVPDAQTFQDLAILPGLFFYNILSSTPTPTQAPTRPPTPTPTPTQAPTPTPTHALTQPPTPTPTLTLTQTPTICEESRGDVDGNGIIDIFDYSLLIIHYGEEGEPGKLIGDLDCNGKVDIFDFSILIINYGKKE